MKKPCYSALIIEDKDEQANIFKKALNMVNFQAKIISDGASAVKYLQTKTPDLVLLDLHLPYISGAKILQQIRTATHLLNTKVILITADPKMANTLQGQCDFVMIKPVSMIQLRNLLLHVFSESSEES